MRQNDLGMNSLDGKDQAIPLNQYTRRKWPINSIVVIIAELGAYAIAIFFVLWLNPHLSAITSPNVTQYLLAYSGCTALVVVYHIICGHYTRRKPFWSDLALFLKKTLTMAGLHGSVILISYSPLSSLWLQTWIAAGLLSLIARYGARMMLIKGGFWTRKTVIIGSGPQAIAAAKAIASEPQLGFEVVTFIQLDFENLYKRSSTIEGFDIPIVALRASELEAQLKEWGSPHTIFAMEHEEYQQHPDSIGKIMLQYPDMNIIPPIPELPLIGTELNHFFSHDILMLRIRNNLAQRHMIFLKRLFDAIAATLLMVICSPLFIYAILRIKQSGGPAFFSHARVGKNGRIFPCYKFRTMVPNAEKILEELLEKDPIAKKEWEKEFKLKNDPRITDIGNFLRKTSLDELPQLWNVIKGEMSLVGPRPVTQSELSRYGDKAVYYLETTPGITGLWQVSGRNNIDYMHRVNLDVWYVRNWNLWYDIAILFKTIKVVVMREGAY